MTQVVPWIIVAAVVCGTVAGGLWCCLHRGKDEREE